MIGRRSATYLVALVMTAWGLPWARAEGGRDAVRQQAFPGANLLALAGDGLLVWADDGRVLLRTATGAWSQEIRLPVKNVLAVAPDGGGFLVSGSSDRDAHAVVLFDGTAKEQQRWKVGEAIFELVVNSRGRWAATQAGLSELLGGGGVGPARPYPDGSGEARPIAPRIYEYEGTTIVCQGADLSKAHRAPARCRQFGGAGWRFEGTALEAPLACGGWLVVRDGKRLERLIVRSMRTGAIAGRHSYATLPLMACADSAALAIGERRLSLVALPSLAPRWTRSIGKGRLRAVAALSNAVAYALEGSNDVFVTSR